MLVERLEHDEVGAGRDSPARPVRVEPAARDDPGDVRAVPVAVVRLRLVVDEVHELHDPIPVQVVVGPRDARVDDGDADTSSVDAEVLGDPPGADRGPRPLERAVDFPVEAHAAHARHAGDGCQAPDRDLGDDRVDPRQPASNLSTGGGNLRLHLGDVGCADDHADRAVTGRHSPLQDGIEPGRGRAFSGR